MDPDPYREVIPIRIREQSLTAPWGFESFLYSKAIERCSVLLKQTHCRVLKLADKPSGLGGGEFGIKSSLWRPNRSLEVRILPLQHKVLVTTRLPQEGSLKNTHCRVLKLADMPSGLGGGELRIKRCAPIHPD